MADRHETVVPIQPASADMLLAKGKTLLFARAIAKAIEVLNQAANLEPESPLPLAYRSLAWRLKPDPDQAVRDAKEAVRCDDNCVEAHLAHTLAFLIQGPRWDPTQALQAYKRVKNQPTRDLDGDLLKLAVFLLLHDFIEAAVVENPGGTVNLLATNLSKGAWTFLKGAYQLAVSAFTDARQKDDNPLAGLGLALSMFRLGEPNGVREGLGLFRKQMPAFYAEEQTAMDRLHAALDTLSPNAVEKYEAHPGQVLYSKDAPAVKIVTSDSANLGPFDGGWRGLLENLRRQYLPAIQALPARERTIWESGFALLEKICQAVESHFHQPVGKDEFTALFTFFLEHVGRKGGDAIRLDLELGKKAYKPKVIFMLLPLIVANAQRMESTVFYLTTCSGLLRAIRDDYRKLTGSSFEVVPWSDADARNLRNCWVIADLDFPPGVVVPRPGDPGPIGDDAGVAATLVKMRETVTCLLESPGTDMLVLRQPVIEEKPQSPPAPATQSWLARLGVPEEDRGGVKMLLITLALLCVAAAYYVVSHW